MSCPSNAVMERKHAELELEEVEEVTLECLDERLDDVESELKKLLRRISKVEENLATLPSSSSVTQRTFRASRVHPAESQPIMSTLSAAMPHTIPISQPEAVNPIGMTSGPSSMTESAVSDHQSGSQLSTSLLLQPMHRLSSKISSRSASSLTLTSPLQISSMQSQPQLNSSKDLQISPTQEQK